VIRIVDEDLIHRYVVRAQMFGAVDDFDLWEMFAQTIHHGVRIGINNHLVNFRNSQQGFDDVVKQRLARQHAVILARHALAVMAHGDEGNKADVFIRHCSDLSYLGNIVIT